MKRLLLSGVFRGLSLFAWLPESGLRVLGKPLGRLLYSLKIRRSIVHANLNYCFSSLDIQQHNRLCQEHFQALGAGLLDSMKVWARPKSIDREAITIDGLEHVNSARMKDQAIIFLGYHTTHMERVFALAAQQLDFSFFYRPNNNPTINHFIQKGRDYFYPSLSREAGLEGGSFKRLTDHLLAKNNLLILPDQDFGLHRTLFAPFFGQPMATLLSPFTLAEKTNAIILPLRYRVINGHVHLSILPALILTGDALVDATHMNDCLAQSINDAPEQYNWVHRRFKTLPEGATSIYSETSR